MDLIKEHVRRVLEDSRTQNAVLLAAVAELEAEGRRIVGGGQTSGEGDWDITDWRTGKLIAAGRGLEADGLTCRALDPKGTWIHIDHVRDQGDDAEEGSPYVLTDGVPQSLGNAVEDWVLGLNTSYEEIADWVGWKVDDVVDALQGDQPHEYPGAPVRGINYGDSPGPGGQLPAIVFTSQLPLPRTDTTTSFPPAWGLDPQLSGMGRLLIYKMGSYLAPGVTIADAELDRTNTEDQPPSRDLIGELIELGYLSTIGPGIAGLEAYELVHPPRLGPLPTE